MRSEFLCAKSCSVHSVCSELPKLCEIISPRDYPVLYDRLATTSQKCKKKDQIQTKKK